MKSGSGGRGREQRTLRAVAVMVLAALFVSCGDSAPPAGATDAGVGVTSVGQALTAEEWPVETLVASRSIWLQDRARVTGGVVATNAASQWLSSNAELVLGPHAVVTGNVKADTLVVQQQSLVTAGASYNSKSGTGTIQGGTSSPLPLPVPVILGSFPSVTPGSQSITVNGGQQQSLAAGRYATITLNSGTPSVPTKLTLTGGLYEIAAISSNNDTVIECAAACEVRVNGTATFLDRAKFRPKTGVAGLGVGNVQLLIKGNGSSSPLGQPPACGFGNDSEARAYIFAPNGTLRLGDRIVQRGKMVAKDVWLGQDADSQGQQLPIVTSGPEDVTVNVGQLAQFEVVASGTGLSYQWQRDGLNIQGATGAVHTIPSAALADNGKQFRVLVSNSAGSVTSASATLTVTSGCVGSDLVCDGQDEDCDGQVDEDFIPVCGNDPLEPLVITCMNGAHHETPCDDGDACSGTEGCADGVCTPGTPLPTDDGNACTVDACDPVDGVSHTPLPVGTPCGSGGQCNAAGQCGSAEPSGTEVTFKVKLPKGMGREQIAVGATGGKVNLGDHAQVLGLGSGGFASVSSVGNYFWTGVHLGSFARLDDVWTEGVAALDGYSHVHGDVRSKAIFKAPTATIDGSQDPNADLRPLEEINWTVFFPDATQGPRQLATGETMALLAGAFGEVDVPQDAHLALSAGTYTFESLDVGFGGTIDIDNSSGPVYVYVEGVLDYSGTITRTESAANVLFGVAVSVRSAAPCRRAHRRAKLAA